jgi:hypothetical protein
MKATLKTLTLACAMLAGAALSAILTVTSAVILIICLKISKGKIRV